MQLPLNQVIIIIFYNSLCFHPANMQLPLNQVWTYPGGNTPGTFTNMKFQSNIIVGGSASMNLVGRYCTAYRTNQPQLLGSVLLSYLRLAVASYQQGEFLPPPPAAARLAPTRLPYLDQSRPVCPI